MNDTDIGVILNAVFKQGDTDLHRFFGDVFFLCFRIAERNIKCFGRHDIFCPIAQFFRALFNIGRTVRYFRYRKNRIRRNLCVRSVGQRKVILLSV